MSELGSGSGSSYPSALDTNSVLEVNSPSGSKTKVRAEVPNDLGAAIIAVQTELGTDPAGTLTNVKTYLQTEHNTDGTHNIPGTSLLATTVPVRDSSRGVVIVANTTNPTYQVDIDADEIILHDSSNLLFKTISVNLTADIAVSGANGLDTGSEAASTNYYIWVIYNSTTTTTAGLLSLSKTSPTMPSGYTYKALVGELFNDSGSDFSYINWWNGTYFLDGEVKNRNSSGAVTIISGTTITSIDLGTVTAGDRIYVETYANIVKGATRGATNGSITKDSGTAVIETLDNLTSITEQVTSEASDVDTVSPVGVLRVTTGGTLSIKFTGTSSGSNGTVAINGGQIYAIFKKKQ